MKSSDHIFLIGYRGSGKTTVARLLAERLGRGGPGGGGGGGGGSGGRSIEEAPFGFLRRPAVPPPRSPPPSSISSWTLAGPPDHGLPPDARARVAPAVSICAGDGGGQ